MLKLGRLLQEIESLSFKVRVRGKCHRGQVGNSASGLAWVWKKDFETSFCLTAHLFVLWLSVHFPLSKICLSPAMIPSMYSIPTSIFDGILHYGKLKRGSTYPNQVGDLPLPSLHPRLE